jgi:hypothetical protein
MISDGVLERLTVQITGDLDGLNDAADRVGTTVSRMTTDIDTHTGKIGKSVLSMSSLVGGAIGGFVSGFAVEGVQALGSFAQATLDAADDMGDLAQRLGVSTTAVQELNGVFVAAGGSPELMNDAMDRLNQSLGEFAMSGKGPAADALKQLGIAGQVSSGQIKGTEDTFYAIVKAMEKIEDPAVRARLSMELFGKSAGKDMVEVLGAGSQAMEEQRAKMKELGLVMDEDLIKKTAEAKLEIDKAKFAMGQWATVGMANVIVGMRDMANSVSAWVTKWSTIGSQLVDGLINGIKSGFAKAAATARELAAVVSDAATGKWIIQSPSKLFYGFGEYIVDGLVLGIGARAPKAKKAMEDLALSLGSVFDRYMTDGERSTQTYLEDLSTVNAGFEAGKISAKGYADVVKRIEASYAKAEGARIAEKIGVGGDLKIAEQEIQLSVGRIQTSLDRSQEGFEDWSTTLAGVFRDLGVNMSSQTAKIAGTIQTLLQIASQAFPSILGSGTKGGGIVDAISGIASIFSGNKTGSVAAPASSGNASGGIMQAISGIASMFSKSSAAAGGAGGAGGGIMQAVSGISSLFSKGGGMGGIFSAVSGIASLFSNKKTPTFSTPASTQQSTQFTLNNFLGNELLDSRIVRLSAGVGAQSFQAARAQVPTDMGRASRNRMW